MDLAHRQAAALEPAPVDFAELGVPVAVRMLLEIFEMEQLERDAGLAPLGMQVGAVGNGPMMRGWGRGPVDAGLQHLVAEGVGVTIARAGPHPRRARSMRWADVYVPHVSPASMSPASMAMGRRLHLRPGPAVSRRLRPDRWLSDG